MTRAIAWLTAATAILTMMTEQAQAQHTSLSRGDIRNGMNQVRGTVQACQRHLRGATTSVNIRVHVAPTGFVLSARATSTSRFPRLDSCVTAAIMQARFTRTVQGKTFTYPFVFRASAPTKPRPPRPGACDEVGCMLNNYTGACCAKYSPRRRRRRPQRLYDRPTRRDIKYAMRGIRGFLRDCARFKRRTGNLFLRTKFKVRPSGRVGSVSVRRGMGQSRRPRWTMRKCVRRAVERASFPRTRLGRSVRYPVVIMDAPPPPPAWRTCQRDIDCGTGNYCRVVRGSQTICMKPMFR